MIKNKIFPVIILVFIFLFFFYPFLTQGKLPIPSDTIIGLYHPFRDFYGKNYPNGIPFKNYLITDPVRQQYPWRELVVSLEKEKKLPLWNPYNFAGVPLLANFQSSAFYPLNILFFVLPMPIGWSVLVIMGSLLAAIFLYLYLDNLRLNKFASFLGAFVFGLCGFSVAWMEWGTVTQTALWLPLLLLSIDKIFKHFNFVNSKLQFKNKKLIIWNLIFLFSLSSSFFAGHLQIFFYALILSIVYFLIRWLQFGRDKKVLLLFLACFFLFSIVTAVQWMPTLKFIMESGRDIDQVNWQKEGWFIPWQHLLQFIVPDFFGNPTTLNYWGTWNYGEFIGYVGILPLLMSLFAIFFRHDKKTLFFGSIFFLSLIFSLPTFFAKIPYFLNIPMLSTSQPTRLLFLTDFSLAILSAFGLDFFIRRKEKFIYVLSFFILLFSLLWIFLVSKGLAIKSTSLDNINVAKNNMFFPSAIFLTVLILSFVFLFNKNKIIKLVVVTSLVILTMIDLFRFGFKFTPFTDKSYLFPMTSTVSFLQNQKDQYRVMSTDSRILPPNFSIMYRIQSVDGYDPLYLKRYAELMAASERNRPDINPPFGFNRIITPKNFDSKIIDLLGVKYILSLADISSPKITKIYQEGITRIYRNKNAFPRVFFVEKTEDINDKNKIIERMFKNDLDLSKIAVVENLNQKSNWSKGFAKIIHYSENEVEIETNNKGEGFLVFTDSFYPNWHAAIDNKETNIYRTDYNFRGVVVSSGKRTIKFYITL